MRLTQHRRMSQPACGKLVKTGLHLVLVGGPQRRDGVSSVLSQFLLSSSQAVTCLAAEGFLGWTLLEGGHDPEILLD